MDKKFSRFELTVIKDDFENSMDGFAMFGLALSSMY